MVSREQLVETANRRGFFFQTAVKHGGAGGFYTLGSQGEATRQRIANSWRETFVTSHGFDEIQSPTILPESVFDASGHLDGFDDAMVTCGNCSSVHRADHLVEDAEILDEAEGLSLNALATKLEASNMTCPTCSSVFESPSVKPFNLMFKTTIGPKEGNTAYLRPETAQGTLSEFWRLREFARGQTPFGVAQVGRAYRNEISPRKSLIRTREFSQAELQTFVLDDSPPLSRVGNQTVTIKTANTGEKSIPVDKLVNHIHPWLAYYVGLTARWLTEVGIPEERLRFRQHTDGELAHYAQDCWDAEVHVHDEWVEIAGIANRGSYDLKAHEEATGASHKLFEEYETPMTAEKRTVNVDMSVLGPQYGSQATAVEQALRQAVQQDQSLTEQDEISVDIEGEEIQVDSSVVTVETDTVEKAGEQKYPQVIEPAFGLERVLYAVLTSSYTEDEVDGRTRRRLALNPTVAPVAVMVTATRPDEQELRTHVAGIRDELRERGVAVAYEDTASIGKRYRRHDEIGTPFSVTIDKQTLRDGSATIRDRDSTKQVRIPTDGVVEIVTSLREGETTFNELKQQYPLVDTK